MPCYGVVEEESDVSGRSSRSLVPQLRNKLAAGLALLIRMMAISRPGFDAETRLAFLSIPDPKNAGYH